MGGQSLLRVLQVGTYDQGGGAEGIGFRLFDEYRRLGHDSWLAVGTKRGSDPNVLVIPHKWVKGRWQTACESWVKKLRRHTGTFPSLRHLCKFLEEKAAQPLAWATREYGWEDFDAPATRQLPLLPPRPPDIIHCHNLHGLLPGHGFYFDLTALPWLSRRYPVVMTLHDAWLLSGHCAHSFSCERWRVGCGKCPDLTISYPLDVDGTAFNWKRKRFVFRRSRLYIATPSRWLMTRVEQSMLAPAMKEGRVIYNGVDLSVFRPGDRPALRAALGIPADARVLLFVANGIRENVWKDFRMLREAVARVAQGAGGSRLSFLALGENAPAEQIGQARITFVPHSADPRVVASYYQAADLYVHAARADTFPTTVLEALACGTPVVATAVGGIPEQVRTEGPGATGALVAPGDAAGMAAAIERLLENDAARRKMGESATADARDRFDLRSQVETYLGWYRDILARHRARRRWPWG